MKFLAPGPSVRKDEDDVPGVRIEPALGGELGETSNVERRVVRMVDSETTRINWGRFLDFTEDSESVAAEVSSEGGMALLAERDLSMGWAAPTERFFLVDESLDMVSPEVGRGELVFLMRSCFGVGGAGEG